MKTHYVRPIVKPAPLFYRLYRHKKQCKVGINTIPAEARDELKKSIIVSDLSAIRCFNETYASKKGIEILPDMEKTLLSGMIELSSKGEKPFLSSEGDRLSYIILANKQIIDIQTAYAAASQANDNNTTYQEKPPKASRSGGVPKL